MAVRCWCVAAVFLLFVVAFFGKDTVVGLDNGLALTPPSTLSVN